MASNDMNSWNDGPDERLRQRWQRLFADFEVQARPSLSRRILAARPAGSSYKGVSRLANVFLLLGLGAGLFYPVQLGEKPVPRGRYAARALPLSPVQPPSRSGGTPSTVPTGQSKPMRLSKIDPPVNESVTGWQPSTYRLTPPATRASGGEISAKRRSSMEQFAGQQPVSGRRVVVTAGPNPVRPRRLLAPLVRSPRTNDLTGPSAPVATGEYNRLLAPVEPSINLNSLSPLPDALVSADQSVLNAVSSDVARLKPREITFLFRERRILPVQLPVIPMASPPSSVPVAGRRRYWFVEAVPLSSFQWMSTSPVSTAYISQVNHPAAFSPATWGYQVYGGIRLQRWRAYLSAAQLRQWAYYTVNHNRYHLEPSPTDPNLVVRETSTVAENVSLPMIGAGFSQVTLLARGRYAVELGGQVSFLPTRGQRMVSARGEVGRRLTLSRTTELQIGVTAEYGLNQLVSDQQQLVIHPFLIGIGLRVQPRSYP